MKNRCSQIVLLPKDVGNLEIPAFYLLKCNSPSSWYSNCGSQKCENRSVSSANLSTRCYLHPVHPADHMFSDIFLGSSILTWTKKVKCCPCSSLFFYITGTRGGCYYNLSAGNFQLKTRNGMNSRWQISYLIISGEV